MNLETERLFMRSVTARDGDALHRLHTDPLVVELIMQGKPLTRAESDARLNLYLDEGIAMAMASGYFISVSRTVT
ncbi:GNAT family N-acetyltransferase [Neorhizobium galegae]|uniref:N-acetyltransferase domain-containing protein n=1 Tax=Neorhizobium galegae bv. orientalis str. HAMBI 540 TaxID=1028800 RepID=A0A068SZ48_NEOGA|nr:GNAT family N-acetyltransferase [Neorhizobium galegae]MCQ1854960.1 GNAT family N-acetyltransferase [Neorhizobium galegae]CDN51438.1 Hypothetical protein RG540_PA07620 [Neorhizobium galegae bv. orientalis str. HAMBI 540]CDZ55480.1 Hypothetical protein NGAL_HAMBI2427_62420 [Neorhizobium galegae bv. orientalis]